MTDELSPQQIEAALRISVHVQGKAHDVRLALPAVGEVLPDVCEPDARLLEDLPYVVLGSIERFDDDAPGLGDARAICAEPAALRSLLSARNRLWSDLRMQGRLFAQCPHCREHEGCFELLSLAAVLGCAPPPIFDAQGVFIEVPVLSNPQRSAVRLSALPKTARLRVAVPSRRLPIVPTAAEAVLRDLDDDDGRVLEADAWQRWASGDETPPAERSHWRHASPGFRAILRLTVALRFLDRKGEVTPEDVEALSIADFLFLDAAYFLTHCVDQPSATALVTACAACGAEYLPLR